MLIGELYKVESDSLNVTLYKKEVSKKDSVIRWRPIAYFATVKNALEHMVNLEVNETGLKDLKTVSEKLDEVLAVVRGLKLA